MHKQEDVRVHVGLPRSEGFSLGDYILSLLGSLIFAGICLSNFEFPQIQGLLSLFFGRFDGVF